MQSSLKAILHAGRQTLRELTQPAKPKVLLTHERDAVRLGRYDEARKQLAPGFVIGPGDVFVDVGCGDGGDLAFAKNCGAHATGFDLDPEAVAAAKRRFLKDGLTDVRCEVDTCDPIPFEDARASHVGCREVLEHVEDPERLMRELVRIGVPGARYLIEVPDPTSEATQRRLAPASYWQRPNHLRVFERAEFERLVTAAGLRVEAHSGFGFYWSIWWTLFWSAGRPIPFGKGGTPVLDDWNRFWDTAMSDPQCSKVLAALDEALPKSQVIVAVKP